jgi:tetratricopeptide (TPR) repeat protein
MQAHKNIERYLQGDLKGQEIKEFEDSLDQDMDLFREYQLRKDIEDALKEDDVMELRTQMQEVMSQKTPNPAYWLKRKAVIAVAAGTLMLGLGSMGYYYHQQTAVPTTDQIFQKYYQPYEATITVRSGAENEVNGMITSALEKYKQQDYASALHLFQQILEKKEDVAASLYSGISYMEIKKYQKANKSFDNVIEDKDNLFLHQAKWYMSMCHIKLNNKEKALAILEELSEESDYYKDKAEEVTRKLKQISTN